MDDPEDLAALARYAEELAAGLERALPAWVVGAVERVVAAAGRPLDDAVRRAAAEAGRRAVDEVGPLVRRLLVLDPDAQSTNPLAIVRGAVRYPTEVLAGLGVPPVRRDAQAERLFPDDPYDLTPASFREVADPLHEPGIRWGAAKAHVILARRRAEGHR